LCDSGFGRQIVKDEGGKEENEDIVRTRTGLDPELEDIWYISTWNVEERDMRRFE
jgi:hypothetical protein